MKINAAEVRELRKSYRSVETVRSLDGHNRDRSPNAILMGPAVMNPVSFRSAYEPFTPAQAAGRGAGEVPRLAAVRLLVVEDNPGMATLLVRSLQREGYAVDAVDNGQDALWSALENDYDAVVLDAMIPPPDGFAVCRQMRAKGRWAPVLMLTARDTVPDRIRGLDAGADDYLTKPFALAELFARIRALTRRDPLERPVVLQVGDLSLDPVSRIVRRGEADLALTPKEFALLQELMRRPGEVLSRTYLINHVWDFAYDGTSNVVDVYMRYLRDKVDRPFGRDTIRTVRGAGYRLDPDG
jgi:two-component system OmpR family response regulator